MASGAERVLRRAWGEAKELAARSQRIAWVDLALALGVAGALFGAIDLLGELTGTLRPTVEIDLSAAALPRYAFFSLCRGLIAYVMSLLFTFAYGYWAAKDKLAERILVPLLDVLQSIPVLGFMPGLVLALVSLFPNSNLGLELAAILMIFTGQAWNMTFSFYHSLRSVPPALTEAGVMYRFDWWQRVRNIELPFATTGLVWNSMMSMAGGWFFLMISEAFVLGKRDFRLPGLGSYMSVAVAKGDTGAMARAVVTMAVMIVALDQFIWRPVVVWSERFRMEETAAEESAQSWFLTLLRRSAVVRTAGEWIDRKLRTLPAPRNPEPAAAKLGERVLPESFSRVLSYAGFAALLAVMVVGLAKLIGLFGGLSLADWGDAVVAGSITLGRVLASTVLGTIWTVPVGLYIGLNPKVSRFAQPVAQVMASFPAPMLFPAVIAALAWAHIPLDGGAILLMLLGTQWYILFNVIAGAISIPADLREVARSYGFGVRDRFWRLYAPGIFPYLVTGWVTAAGGAWNASIVSEYVSFRGELLTAHGLGAVISRAADEGNFPRLASAVLVMSVIVVLFNSQVWRRLYHLGEERFSLAK